MSDEEYKSRTGALTDYKCIYRFTRNPTYLGGILVFAGLPADAVLCRNFWSLRFTSHHMPVEVCLGQTSSF